MEMKEWANERKAKSKNATNQQHQPQQSEKKRKKTWVQAKHCEVNMKCSSTFRSTEKSTPMWRRRRRRNLCAHRKYVYIVCLFVSPESIAETKEDKKCVSVSIGALCGINVYLCRCILVWFAIASKKKKLKQSKTAWFRFSELLTSDEYRSLCVDRSFCSFFRQVIFFVSSFIKFRWW